MILNRLGTFHGAPYRYINYLKDNPDIVIRWFHLHGDPMIESLMSELELLGLNNILFYSLTETTSNKLRLVQRIALFTKRNNILQNRLGVALLRIYLRSIRVDRNILALFKEEVDVTWCGNNDLDYSLTFLAWIKLKLPHLFINYSYKEHRCTFRLDESLGLSLADGLIIPSKSSLLALNEVYKMDFSTKTFYADEDWRSRSISEFVRENKKNKLSKEDECPHVIILTRYAEYGNIVDPRRGSRINFLRIMKVFAEKGLKIHLKSMCICDNIGGVCMTENTPYHDLKIEYPDNIFIEEPISLNRDADYLDLSVYDFGIIHNYEEGESTNSFSRVNIPNRLFEYYASGVMPIVLRNTLMEVEQIIEDSNFGLIVDNYKEAASKMNDYIRNDDSSEQAFIYEKSFETFMMVLLNGNNDLLKNR